MNRRNFIVNTILLTMATSIDAKVNVNKTFDMYIDESGNMGDPYNPFVIGALMIDSSYKHETLNQIQKASGFNLHMCYKSSNKYKLDLVSPLLQEFFASDKMRFSALVFSNNINEEWPSEKKHRLLLYKHNYKNLVKLVSKKNMKLNIYLSTRMSRSQDESLKQFLEQKFKNISTQFIGIKDTKSSTILSEFTDVLTGSIYGDITETGDLTKQKIIYSIKSSVNVKTLSNNINFNNGKFFIKVSNKI